MTEKKEKESVAYYKRHLIQKHDLIDNLDKKIIKKKIPKYKLNFSLHSIIF